MDNAILYYEQINSFEDIKNLIGMREDIFIDFKQTVSKTGKMEEDDKVNFSKAASGFAHQQGGILVWGVSTKKDDKEVSIATELKPISDVGTFCSALQGFIKVATDPCVDGIQHKVIYDSKELDTGFVVSLFPRSDRVHMSMYGRAKHAFYKRLGDGFHPLPTNEIRTLFFRSLSPDLTIHITRSERESRYSSLKFSLENIGKGIAKNCSVYLGLASQNKSIETSWNLSRLKKQMMHGTDEISGAIQILEVNRSPKYKYHAKFNPGAFICPGEDVYIGTLWLQWIDEVADAEVTYKILAENMIPKEEKNIALQSKGR